jgi:hypothetical protein
VRMTGLALWTSNGEGKDLRISSFGNSDQDERAISAFRNGVLIPGN